MKLTHIVAGLGLVAAWGLLIAGFSKKPAAVETPTSRSGTNLVPTSNQSMKPTALLRSDFSVFATTPCRGLSLSR
jgi:hypothetical protein